MAKDDKPFLQTAARAGYKILLEYYKTSLATRHFFVATICDPRYKMNLLTYIYDAEGGANSPKVKRGKAHFEHVYGQYRRRAVQIAVIERERAQEQLLTRPSNTIVDDNDWRNNPLHGYAEHVAS